MNIEISGKIVAILPEVKGTNSKGEWAKNAFVVEWVDNGFTKKTCMEVLGADKFEKIKQNIVVGNNVTVGFDVTSREWNGRWFTTCNCFRCMAVGGNQQQTAQAPQAQSPVPNAQVENNAPQPSGNADVLPF